MKRYVWSMLIVLPLQSYAMTSDEKSAEPNNEKTVRRFSWASIFSSKSSSSSSDNASISKASSTSIGSSDSNLASPDTPRSNASVTRKVHFNDALNTVHRLEIDPRERALCVSPRSNVSRNVQQSPEQPDLVFPDALSLGRIGEEDESDDITPVRYYIGDRNEPAEEIKITKITVKAAEIKAANVSKSVNNNSNDDDSDAYFD